MHATLKTLHDVYTAEADPTVIIAEALTALLAALDAIVECNATEDMRTELLPWLRRIATSNGLASYLRVSSYCDAQDVADEAYESVMSAVAMAQSEIDFRDLGKE